MTGIKILHAPGFGEALTHVSGMAWRLHPDPENLLTAREKQCARKGFFGYTFSNASYWDCKLIRRWIRSQPCEIYLSQGSEFDAGAFDMSYTCKSYASWFETEDALLSFIDFLKSLPRRPYQVVYQDDNWEVNPYELERTLNCNNRVFQFRMNDGDHGPLFGLYLEFEKEDDALLYKLCH